MWTAEAAYNYSQVVKLVVLLYRSTVGLVAVVIG